MEPTRPARYDLVRGTVETIDLVGRELHILTDAGLMRLDVPVLCQIIMYEDRVRLRMLQPSDVVEVTFTWELGQAVAQSIEVHGLLQRELHAGRRAIAKGLAN